MNQDKKKEVAQHLTQWCLNTAELATTMVNMDPWETAAVYRTIAAEFNIQANQFEDEAEAHEKENK